MDWLSLMCACIALCVMESSVTSATSCIHQPSQVRSYSINLKCITILSKIVIKVCSLEVCCNNYAVRGYTQYSHLETRSRLLQISW